MNEEIFEATRRGDVLNADRPVTGLIDYAARAASPGVDAVELIADALETFGIELLYFDDD